ncbi:hypothetical protein LB572_28975 [Mesorhizobium sp. BH1-1-5]|uniref:hypothetical protein n=1 Tax=unclassified Mesorhizobium TaxID=325217 RepID=UPI00112CC396|nr:MULTISPECIES: hypothetical protein [unclassified Mesorhizobium]MBZ9991136.1 hypothetical protein [Mesorhizobium sp. BH1-1-5]TPJ74703.1 hypothetical protein FJ471_01840 [Mesorhizobium sp. B2-7-1]
MHHPTRLENLQFARSMLKEVRSRLDASGEALLTYLLDMVVIEADERATAIRLAQQSTTAIALPAMIY